MLKKTYLILLFAGILFSCNNDDDLVATCDTPTSISANTVTNTSATISWIDANSAGSYILEYGVSGFTLGTGTLISETNTSTILTGLNANTTYDVYIQTICSETNISMNSDVFSFTTLAPNVVPEFRLNLAELNIYSGDIALMQPSPYAFEYDLNTRLFSDYAHKQRIIALPQGEKMTYDGEGLPLFPDNTVIAKTFYYNLDERDESLGQHIIETRILIKIDGAWETGDYKWNESQTEAVLDPNGSTVPVTWIDDEGESNSINYEIPSDTDCFTCHRVNTDKTPIGPKMRTLNFNVNGTNQLQSLIDSDMLEGLADPSTVSVLPKWDDEDNYTLEERARAYFDINCAHCHIEGGFCEEQSNLRLSFETAFEESSIFESRFSITARIQNVIPNYSMPLIGTTIIHDEGVSLILEYLDSLE